MSSRSSSYLCTSPCRELCSRGLWGSFWSSWQTAPGPRPALPPGALGVQGHSQFRYQGPGSEPCAGTWKALAFLCGHSLSLLLFTTVPCDALLSSYEGRDSTVILSVCLRPCVCNICMLRDYWQDYLVFVKHCVDFSCWRATALQGRSRGRLLSPRSRWGDGGSQGDLANTSSYNQLGVKLGLLFFNLPLSSYREKWLYTNGPIRSLIVHPSCLLAGTMIPGTPDSSPVPSIGWDMVGAPFTDCRKGMRNHQMVHLCLHPKPYPTLSGPDWSPAFWGRRVALSHSKSVPEPSCYLLVSSIPQPTSTLSAAGENAWSALFPPSLMRVFQHSSYF